MPRGILLETVKSKIELNPSIKSENHPGNGQDLVLWDLQGLLESQAHFLVRNGSNFVLLSRIEGRNPRTDLKIRETGAPGPK